MLATELLTEHRERLMRIARRMAAEMAGAEESIERAEYLLEARAKLARLRPAERRTLVLIGAGYPYEEVGQSTRFSYCKTNRSAAEGRAALRAMAA